MRQGADYWTPGWEGWVNDVKVRCVVGDKIPEKVWQRLKYYRPGSDHLWAVGIRYSDGTWHYCDKAPTYWYTGGSCIKGSEIHSALVPIDLLGPTENEFGEVMP